MTGKPLKILRAGPRGFCAGVDRAIKIVEMAIEKWGAPVYVRHEIVHNRFVVEGPEARGAVFVEDLDDLPDGVPGVFSAHGVPQSGPAGAGRRRVGVGGASALVLPFHTVGLIVVEEGHGGA